MTASAWTHRYRLGKDDIFNTFAQTSPDTIVNMIKTSCGTSRHIAYTETKGSIYR